MSHNDDDFDQFVNEVLTEPEKPEISSHPTVEEEHRNHYSAVMLTTTNEVPGRSIIGCRGLVSGRFVLGQAGFRAVAAGLSDALGRRSKSTEELLLRIEQECFRQLKYAAYMKGCQAVVGTTLCVSEAAGEADLFFGIATGTAVLLE